MRNSNHANNIKHDFDRADIKSLGIKALATLCLCLSCSLSWSEIESEKRIRELEQRITALEAALGMTPSGGTSHSKLTPRSLELDVSQSSEIDSGRNLTLEAGDQILLKVGKAQIRMTKSGLIDIRGTEISVKQNQVELIKGKKISDN